MTVNGLLSRLRRRVIIPLTLALASIPGPAPAGEEAISWADTGFVLMASAFVMLMIPGAGYSTMGWFPGGTW
ncbi:MAG: hypothetical protein IBX71_02240 [Candidatus Desulforudis sp.]|nr:hypothetical protein [Desulforudis sp.]